MMGEGVRHLLTIACRSASNPTERQNEVLNVDEIVFV